MIHKNAVARNLSLMEGVPAAIVKQTAPPFVNVRTVAIHLPKKLKNKWRILILKMEQEELKELNNGSKIEEADDDVYLSQ